MNIKTKLTMLLLALLLPTVASAYDFTVDDVFYNITGDNTVEVTRKNTTACGYTGEVTIPSTVTNGGVTYTVTAVGERAFYSGSNVTAVHLPGTITSIGEYAFYRCTKMADVNIPDGVVTINNRAFNECKALTTISIPSSVTAIGNYAFYQCTVLAQITFNEGLQTIGTSAFDNCKVLTDVVFPASVTSIGQSAFSNCSGLSSVTFYGACSIGLYAFNYCDAITSVTCLSDTPPSMYNSSCFTSTVYSNASLQVPIYAIDSYRTTNYWNQFVTIIGLMSDFVVDGIYYKILSNNEVAVNHGPDTGCYSGNVNIPPIVLWNGTLYQVTEITDYAFYGCPEVTDVTLPTSITAIGAYAFAGTGLTTFIIPDFMIAIPAGLFSNCTQLMSVTIHANVASVGERAFAGCTALETVNCKAVTPPEIEFENDCFADEAYANATLYVPGANFNAYKGAPGWRKFANIVGILYDFEVDGIYYTITGPTSVAVTARDNRYSSYSGSIEIPSMVTNNGTDYVVTSIAQYAFYNSTDLTSVSIPTSVSEIGDFAFYGCSNLSQVICNCYTPPTMASSYVFYPCYQNATLIVPSGTEEQYQTTDWWNLFTQVKVILRGDVNGDGTVNIADVTVLIDYLLSSDAANLMLMNTDVNKDGSINIADITSLIDYLLNGSWPFDGTVTVNGVTFKMILVEGGTFTMGGTPEQGDDVQNGERPTHQVTLSSYYIGETEVTQALWQVVMGSNPSCYTGDLYRPVERVSWNDCQVFISRLNEMTGLTFRLPTEAEWEYAARGGNKSLGYKYAGSNIIDEVAWYNSDTTTRPVAMKKANELGLYDMSGNVFEWCQDWYGNYSSEDQTNPTGPITGNYRILRGGSFVYPGWNCRVSYRSGNNPTQPSRDWGLRLAL